ncbi:transmembrane protein 186 [Cylas formicarius]|uniref:transmembrane protein 186 n=1 Tax=Cylas formicarius TaxID=197179 RepID=UPI002958C0A5|nr:transmembrane protein 186 [Cylas formicarius]
MYNSITNKFNGCTLNQFRKFVYVLSIRKYSAENEGGKYIPVYNFPYIRPFTVVNRLKLYQTVLTGISVPGGAILSQLGCVSWDTAQSTTLLGVSACVMLYGIGFLTTKFIGFIYYNPETDSVKLAYGDFWGRRKDLVMPRSDVMPLSELPTTPLDKLFVTFRRYNSKETLKLDMRFGVILDAEKFKQCIY